MGNLIEQLLLLVHKQGYLRQILPALITLGLFAGLALLHIGVLCHLWAPDKPAVNKGNCSCSCFDTVFRGGYEYPPVGYKHIYLNATSNAFRIWLVLVTNVILFYKVIERVFKILCKAPAIRRSFLALLCVNIYPHYYSFWSYLNYYNEEVYDYFYHHLYFYITEWFVTFVVINLLDQRATISFWKLLFIIDVSIIHLIVSGADQLVSHVIFQRAPFFINARDVSLAVCDVAHLGVAFFQLTRISSRGSPPNAHSTSMSYPSAQAHSTYQHSHSGVKRNYYDYWAVATRYEVLASFIFVLSSCTLLRIF